MVKTGRPKKGEKEYRGNKITYRVNDAEKEEIVNYFGKISKMRDFVLDHIQEEKAKDESSIRK